MSFQPGAVLNTQAFGNRPENIEVPHIDVRAPTSTDTIYPIGKRWLDKVAGNEYVLANFSSSGAVLSANWAFLGGTSTDLNSLTTDDSTVVLPTAGTIKISGTANQIATTGSNTPGTVTLAVPATFVGPGSITATTTLTATLGNITATNGNLVLAAGGNHINMKGGAVTDFCGTATLASGTVTVNNTNIATGDIILISRVSANGSTTFGVLSYTISNGASFTITSLILGTPGSTQTADTSIVSYVIVRPI